jgi:Zn-dependent protease
MTATSELAVFLRKVAILAPPFLFTITCHEVAHGLAAYRLGDPTAKLAGRLTLNPLRHIDPVGLLVFIVTSLSGFAIGWAKPVPVNPAFFKNPRRGTLLVSAAGPAANLLLAALFALGYHLGLAAAPRLPAGLIVPVLEPLLAMAQAGAIVSVVLGVFNLLPVPPLDGGGVVAGLLPPRMAYRYERLGRYGFVIVLLLVMTGFVQTLLWPIVLWIVRLLGIPL